MEDIKEYLHTGTSKSTFSLETHSFLSELENNREVEGHLKFPRFFQHYFLKLNKYRNAHHVYNFYKTTHLFDPRQLLCIPCISHDIDSFAAIKDLQDLFTDLLEEFQIYVNYQDDLTISF